MLSHYLRSSTKNFMNKNLFDTIADWLSNQKMSPSEKRDMREVLVRYATNHPVKSGLLSPYAFRYIGVAFASLVLVLGGSIGITSAASRALPNQPLYGVKIWIEEFNANNQKTPEAKIAFETNRIKTRFAEATALAINHQLDDSASQVIQSGLEHSQEAVRNEADAVQDTNPELALRAVSGLETSFSSNGRILATIEQNTDQDIGTVVLAAQVTTAQLATEKMKFEQIVALQPNSDTKATTEAKLSAITATLATLPTPASATSTVSASSTTDASTTVVTASASTTAAAVPDANSASALVAGAKEKISQGSYSEALVSLQNAEQVIDEATLTKSLEETYDITDTASVPPPAPTTTTLDASTSVAN